MLRSRTLACAFLSLLVSAHAEPVINEIMFHPGGVPEDPALEWIELHNPDEAVANVGGWQFSKGVKFTIPPGTTIPAGGYLVVAAGL